MTINKALNKYSTLNAFALTGRGNPFHAFRHSKALACESQGFVIFFRIREF